MKLPILLRSLRPEEHKEFEKFLQSPFFKASDQYLKYFKFLCKHHPGFDLNKPDLQTAYRKCFGPDSLTDTRLYNLLSGLGKQLEQFLVVNMVLPTDEEPGNGLYGYLLVRALGMRNTGAYFRSEAREQIEELTAHPTPGIDDYLVIQQLHHQVYYNPDTPKFGEHTHHLQQAAEYLDRYYCMMKLRYSAEMKARERIVNTRYAFPMLDAVMEHSALSSLIDNQRMWGIYHDLVELYQKGVSEKGFRTLMAVFTSEFHRIPGVDQNVLLRHLINCGISLVARDCEVEADLLALYKLSIEIDILLSGNRITHQSFINISNLAGLCGEFDWAESFINRFSIHLEDDKKQSTLDLAKAGLYYNKGALDKALDCLNTDIYAVPSLDLPGRALMLKIVFDRYVLFGKDYEFLIAQMKSFEKFIQVRPLTEEKKYAQLNWIRFLRKLATTKFNLVAVPDSQKLVLRKKLKALQPVVYKKWLEVKIDLI